MKKKTMIKKKKSKVKTKELCQLAVENDVYYLVLQYVPDELRTKELEKATFGEIIIIDELPAFIRDKDHDRREVHINSLNRCYNLEDVYNKIMQDYFENK